ncbi:unnamed protein product [Lactuca virosa]|uniref:BED-type domain-containing protein n=1 Tax=Lactuca virosa TaxID=75947 RepID=A0AAU9LBX2_9ASTR|nr:unnamed protein product [Lactuca virosa]
MAQYGNIPFIRLNSQITTQFTSFYFLYIQKKPLSASSFATVDELQLFAATSSPVIRWSSARRRLAGHQMSKTDDYIEVEDETIEVDNPTNDQVPQEKEKKTNEFNPRLKVWNEFERYKDEKGVQRCKCKHCGGGNYKCESGGYGTKNLGYHLNKCKVYLAKLHGGQKQVTFQYGDENKLSAWKFDQNESRKALAHMLVVDELPFSFVEGAGFRYYNSVNQPLFKVPCRSTSTTDVYQLFVEEKEKIRDFIKKNVGRICLTTDTWTSKQQSCYMCLTAHFIDNEWKLKEKVLCFSSQESHHGVDIGKMVEK